MRTLHAILPVMVATMFVTVALLPAEQKSTTEIPPAETTKNTMLKIKLTSVLVDDQEKALKFYTEVLGFVKKQDIPMGTHRWLTVVSADAPEGVEIVLEPTGLPASKVYQKALFDAGVPLTAFMVDDIQKTYEALEKKQVRFHTKPTKMGAVTIAVFEDTCGNLIQMFQP